MFILKFISTFEFDRIFSGIVFARGADICEVDRFAKLLFISARRSQTECIQKTSGSDELSSLQKLRNQKVDQHSSSLVIEIHGTNEATMREISRLLLCRLSSSLSHGKRIGRGLPRGQKPKQKLNRAGCPLRTSVPICR